MCILPAQQCNYTFKKGPKKGERCAKCCSLNEKLCGFHLKQQHKGIVSLSTTHPTVKPTKTRINRLARNKQYFFYKIMGFLKVMLKCGDKLYILRLPKGMRHPENPSKKHYLIRDNSGTTVWKALQ